MLFFRELGSTGTYFRGFRKPSKEKTFQKHIILKEKPPFCLIFKLSLAFAPRPLIKFTCIYFELT